MSLRHLFLLLFLTACAHSAGPVARVHLNPTGVVLPPSTTYPFEAVAEDAQGHVIPNIPISWASTNEQVAQVDPGGVVTALTEGTTEVIAHTGGVSSNPAVVTVSAADTPVAFPLKLAPGKRYLVDQHNKPFLIHGDSPWSLMVSLTKEEAEIYLEDRRKKGFNTILVNLLEHKFAPDAPNNRYGEGPFTKPNDYSTPNEAYFSHVDWVIRKAAERGILVLLTPSYLGFDGGDEGWYQVMRANGVAKLREYGRYLGKRYRNFPNLIWVNGGDYNPPDKDLVRAIVEGIKELDPVHLHTVHAGVVPATDYWDGEPWLDINNIYTYQLVYPVALAQYNRPDKKPFFFMEGVYEGERSAPENVIRSQAYFALLSGAMGQLFGNSPLWFFGAGWKEALGSRGAQDMTQVWALFSKLPWEKLVPDQKSELITSGRGSASDYTVAALADDGSFALAYLPSSRTLTVNLFKLRGPRVRARWYDPTNGVFTGATEFPLNRRAAQAFTPPGKNSTRSDDWILLLESVQ